jgi:hypothetical protein
VLYGTVLDRLAIHTVGCHAFESDILNLEDYIMRFAHRSIALLFLTAALAVPVATMAAPAPQATVQLKIYDKSHKDYHVWDDNEDRAYTTFRGSHPGYNEKFAKTNSKQQTTYWNWRHANPDRN